MRNLVGGISDPLNLQPVQADHGAFGDNQPADQVGFDVLVFDHPAIAGPGDDDHPARTMVESASNPAPQLVLFHPHSLT